MAKGKTSARAGRGSKSGGRGSSERLPVVALKGQRKARGGHEENPDTSALGALGGGYCASKEEALTALSAAWFDEYVEMGDVTVRRRALYIANRAALHYGASAHEIETCATRAWTAALSRGTTPPAVTPAYQQNPEAEANPVAPAMSENPALPQPTSGFFHGALATEYVKRIPTFQQYSNQRFDEVSHLAYLLTDEDRRAGRMAPSYGYSRENIDRAQEMIALELASRGYSPGPHHRNPEENPVGGCGAAGCAVKPKVCGCAKV
jgi:hypothetical protein